MPPMQRAARADDLRLIPKNRDRLRKEHQSSHIHNDPIVFGNARRSADRARVETWMAMKPIIGAAGASTRSGNDQ